MSKKIINQFDSESDAITHKVKLKPLDIPADLRSQVEERDREEKEKEKAKSIINNTDELLLNKIESKKNVKSPEVRLSSPMNKLRQDN